MMQRAGKELTKARQEIEDMELPKQKYEKVFVFKGHDDNYLAARDALWDICDAEDWATAKSGRRGSNKTQSYHGGLSGKFKITCDEYAYKCVRMRRDAHCGAEEGHKRDRMV
jgi:hypothetical protein